MSPLCIQFTRTSISHNLFLMFVDLKLNGFGIRTVRLYYKTAFDWANLANLGVRCPKT